MLKKCDMIIFFRVSKVPLCPVIITSYYIDGLFDRGQEVRLSINNPKVASSTPGMGR